MGFFFSTRGKIFLINQDGDAAYHINTFSAEARTSNKVRTINYVQLYQVCEFFCSIRSFPPHLSILTPKRTLVTAVRSPREGDNYCAIISYLLLHGVYHEILPIKGGNFSRKFRPINHIAISATKCLITMVLAEEKENNETKRDLV